MDAIRRRKIAIKILACALALVVLVGAALCVWVVMDARVYTEEQHLYRIRKRAERRFLGEGSAYTGLEVYPLYDENDEFHYALIEFEPQGFIYVEVNSACFISPGMYLLADFEPTPWAPYSVAFEEATNAKGENVRVRKEVPLLDENGEQIRYSQSHFKVAGIADERRYLLCTPAFEGSDSSRLIPAVKRGGQYLDLVDGALIDYAPGVYSETFASGLAGFSPKFPL